MLDVANIEYRIPLKHLYCFRYQLIIDQFCVGNNSVGRCEDCRSHTISLVKDMLKWMK